MGPADLLWNKPRHGLRDQKEETMGASWIVLVFMDTVEMMKLAVQDCAAQEGLPAPPRVLAISQGSSQETRREAETCFGRIGKAVLPWWFEPALPSLSAAWNRGLDFCWALGAEEVLVTQADVRLHRSTYEALRQARLMTGALMATAVGRRAGEVDLAAELEKVSLGRRGGPDYSCYLISRECHEKYRFDEAYTPAYLEDIDHHRRIMLGGGGDRVFSVDVPYIHHAAQTLKQMSPEQNAAVQAAIGAGSRAYHARKWGGGANEELFMRPFGEMGPVAPGPPMKPEEMPQWVWDCWQNGEPVTTSALFDAVRARW